MQRHHAAVLLLGVAFGTKMPWTVPTPRHHTAVLLPGAVFDTEALWDGSHPSRHI